MATSNRNRQRREDRRRTHANGARFAKARGRLALGAGLGAGATLAMGGGVAHAAGTDFMVTTNADTGGTCPSATTCTLRDAISASNLATGSGTNTISFASSLSGDTITLGSHLPLISYSVDIEGLGAGALTISGGGTVPIFYDIDGESPGMPVAISGLSLIDGSDPGSTGGAIANYNAALTVSNATISGNSAAFGGGINSGGTGGSLTITNSSVSGNAATKFGGGIRAVGPLTIEDSTISGNHADESTIGAGGGAYLYNPSSDLIANSTIANNTDHLIGGGGLAVGVSGVGGTVTIEGSTISGNYADVPAANIGESYGGGGILNRPNEPAVVDLENTIVAGNTVSSSGVDPDLRGPFNSAFSLIGDDNADAPIDETVMGSDIAGSDMTPVDPQLGALAGNGGPTESMALAPTSPAVNAGSGFGLTADQRGEPRPSPYPGVADSLAAGADGSDIGAFELQAPPAPGGGGSGATPAVPPTGERAAALKKCKKKKGAKRKKCKKKANLLPV